MCIRDRISTTAVSIAEKAGEFPLVSYVSSTFPDRSRMDRVRAVSYTHLDVYKRQDQNDKTTFNDIKSHDVVIKTT